MKFEIEIELYDFLRLCDKLEYMDMDTKTLLKENKANEIIKELFILQDRHGDILDIRDKVKVEVK